jgi:uroporphyrinogen decarboxylase
MRQAGRYQAEYRAIRAKVSFLELCKTPDLAAEVTVFAVKQLGVDASIIFADILLLLEPMGVPIHFGTDGEGPSIPRPVRTSADVDALTGDIDVRRLSFVGDAIRKVKAEIPRTPLIGFGGAPFTLASYAIEGGGSKNYVDTKTMMYADPGLFRTLMEKLSQATILHLNAQIAAGADVVQLFDSWAGALSPADYRTHVLPHMKAIVKGITPGVPVISFSTGTTTYVEEQAASGASVVSVDWRIDLEEASRRLPGVALQGNLDPVALLAPLPELRRMAKEQCDSMRDRAGYIFNLGHGILPSTPVDHARALVDTVHELSQR